MPMVDTTTSTKQTEDRPDYRGRVLEPWAPALLRAGRYRQSRSSGPVAEERCFLAPLAHEAERRIDLIFDAERAFNGLAADKRLELRQTHVTPLAADRENWMRAGRAKFSRHNDLAKAIGHLEKPVALAVAA
jgi:hypothetical protein